MKSIAIFGEGKNSQENILKYWLTSSSGVFSVHSINIGEVLWITRRVASTISGTNLSTGESKETDEKSDKNSEEFHFDWIVSHWLEWYWCLYSVRRPYLYHRKLLIHCAIIITDENSKSSSTTYNKLFVFLLWTLRVFNCIQ